MNNITCHDVHTKSIESPLLAIKSNRTPLGGDFSIGWTVLLIKSLKTISQDVWTKIDEHSASPHTTWSPLQQIQNLTLWWFRVAASSAPGDDYRWCSRSPLKQSCWWDNPPMHTLLEEPCLPPDLSSLQLSLHSRRHSDTSIAKMHRCTSKLRCRQCGDSGGHQVLICCSTCVFDFLYTKYWWMYLSCLNEIMAWKQRKEFGYQHTDYTKKGSLSRKTV